MIRIAAIYNIRAGQDLGPNEPRRLVIEEAEDREKERREEGAGEEDGGGAEAGAEEGPDRGIGIDLRSIAAGFDF